MKRAISKIGHIKLNGLTGFLAFFLATLLLPVSCQQDEVTTNAGLRVETFLPDGKKASSFILGRTKMHSGDDDMTARAYSMDALFVGQYLRLTDEEKPMLVRNIFRVNADPKEWRDPFVLLLRKNEIARITGQDYILVAGGEGGERRRG